MLMVGCGVTTATWLPWVKSPKTVPPPKTVAKTKEQPKTKAPTTPPKTKPKPPAIPVEPAAARNSVAQFNLAFDLEAARHRVEALSWFRRSTLQRILTDTVLVTVEGSRPLALSQ